MSKTKSTKSALLMSLTSLLLCFAMLIGSTFAWFTDSATASVNTIQSGTLDVALEMKQGNDWVNAEGETLSWVKAEGHEDDEVLWEPGCTYELPELRIVNEGNLALKYKIQITGIQGDAKLNEAIEWTITNNGQTYAVDQEVSLAANDSATLTISGHMKKTAGNEYQNLSIDNIAITVVATQDTAEFDSTTDQYDVNAPYPVVAAALVNATGVTVVQAQDNTIKLTAPAESLTNNISQLSLTVDEVAAPSGITVGNVQEEQTFEVSLKDQTGAKVEAQEGTLFTVDLYVGPDLDNLKVYHSGIEMTNDGVTLTDAADHYIYNKATGYVTMKVSSFSPFTVVYDLLFSVETVADLASIDGGWYLGNNTAGIYKLENDLAVEKILMFGKDVVIDLNGRTLTTTASYWANYSNRAPEITIKNGTVVVKDYNNFWNVSRNEVVINLENVTIDATKASAAFRTMPSQVSHKLTINADANTVINGTFLSADPTYSANAETPSITNIVVNGVHATVPSYGNAMRLYAQYKNSKVNAEFNNCVFDCSNGGYPVYCGAKPAENGTVSLTMNGCTLKARLPYGISGYICNYGQDGVTVALNDCLGNDGAALTTES